VTEREEAEVEKAGSKTWQQANHRDSGEMHVGKLKDEVRKYHSICAPAWEAA
jgi:hypothetical protein